MQINKIYNENCLETMSKMPDDFIDLTITSPPYNMRTRIRNGKYTTREKSEHFSKKYKHFHDAYSIEDYYDVHKEILTELLRVSKTIIWNISIVTGSKEAIFKLLGYFAKNIKDVIIWDKGNGQPAMHEGCINRATELLFILENNSMAGRVLTRFNFERGTLDDIWRIKRQRSITKYNSAVFPELLAGKAIKNFSKIGDIVYDPFMGSGTTAKMAIKYNRNYIGSEISKESCEVIEKRLESVQTEWI